jgi:HTH-type transcriptional regulator/antitoxin HigA
MRLLELKVIKNRKQYDEYCERVEDLVFSDSNKNQDEIELLNLLIETWDRENNSMNDLSPIELLESLMKENNLKSKDLAGVLELSKGTVSKILNYQKGLSKETIRKLALFFRLSQESFNRPYELVKQINIRTEAARL